MIFKVIVLNHIEKISTWNLKKLETSIQHEKCHSTIPISYTTLWQKQINDNRNRFYGCNILCGVLNKTHKPSSCYNILFCNRVVCQKKERKQNNWHKMHLELNAYFFPAFDVMHNLQFTKLTHFVSVEETNEIIINCIEY